MIPIQNALKQMAWADEKLFAFLNELPIEALRARAKADDWHVAGLTFHLIASADWYNFELGRPLRFTQEPESIEEIFTLGQYWQEVNEFLVSESTKEDERVYFLDNDKQCSEMRSSVLVQAVIHSVEHRVQIFHALEINGISTPNLEDFSEWGYQDFLRTSPQ